MQEIIIEPKKKSSYFLQELWHYRELFFFLAWRDILVRYKQTFIGIAWSALRPLLTMGIFTIVFNRIAGLSSEGVPYVLFVFAAMLPWSFFSNTVSEGSQSLIVDSNLITKIYFPRLIIPTTSLAVGLIDFLISSVLLFVLMLFMHHLPNQKIIFLIPFLLLLCLFSLGMTYFISALNVKYRDFRYVIPFIIQVGLYISPIGFSSTLIPEQWRLIYSLNPLVGIVDGFRWCLLGDSIALSSVNILSSVVVSLMTFIFGVNYFLKTERQFADII